MHLKESILIKKKILFLAFACNTKSFAIIILGFLRLHVTQKALQLLSSFFLLILLVQFFGRTAKRVFRNALLFISQEACYQDWSCFILFRLKNGLQAVI